MTKTNVNNLINALGSVKDCIIEAIKEDFCNTNKDAIKVFLEAYNEWQEQERDGVDYIFDINEKEDLLCVVKGGMTAKEISDIATSRSSGLFFFGCNYPTPKLIKDEQDLKIALFGQVHEVVEFVLCYPYLAKSKEFYRYYVTKIINP